jgi:hypothetical protein
VSLLGYALVIVTAKGVLIKGEEGSLGVVLHGGNVWSMGNGGEGHRPVVVATGSWFGEEQGDGGELIDVEVGPDGSRPR